MILDNSLLFTGTSNGASGGITLAANTDFPTAQTTTAASNVIDLGEVLGLPAYASGGGARDIGVGDDPSLKLLARVTTAFVSAGGATLQLQLQGAPDDGSGGQGAYTTMWTSAAYSIAQAKAGADLANIDVPRVIANQPLPRFLKLNFIIGTSTMSAGGIEACIVIDRDDQIMGTSGNISGYPAGITIAN